MSYQNDQNFNEDSEDFSEEEYAKDINNVFGFLKPLGDMLNFNYNNNREKFIPIFNGEYIIEIIEISGYIKYFECYKAGPINENDVNTHSIEEVYQWLNTSEFISFMISFLNPTGYGVWNKNSLHISMDEPTNPKRIKIIISAANLSRLPNAYNSINKCHANITQDIQTCNIRKDISFIIHSIRTEYFYNPIIVYTQEFAKNTNVQADLFDVKSLYATYMTFIEPQLQQIHKDFFPSHIFMEYEEDLAHDLCTQILFLEEGSTANISIVSMPGIIPTEEGIKVKFKYMGNNFYFINAINLMDNQYLNFSNSIMQYFSSQYHQNIIYRATEEGILNVDGDIGTLYRQSAYLIGPEIAAYSENTSGFYAPSKKEQIRLRSEIDKDFIYTYYTMYDERYNAWMEFILVEINLKKDKDKVNIFLSNPNNAILLEIQKKYKIIEMQSPLLVYNRNNIQRYNFIIKTEDLLPKMISHTEYKNSEESKTADPKNNKKGFLKK